MDLLILFLTFNQLNTQFYMSKSKLSINSHIKSNFFGKIKIFLQDYSLQVVLLEHYRFMRKFRLVSFRNWTLLIFALIILSSCSTKKNTFTRRTYHNLTAHYNGWWNGNESLKSGISRLDNNISDDFTKTLVVFNYGNESQVSSILSDMDRAIEKGSLTAQRHSMWFKNREHCNWIDDSYMLIGKANFFKQKYTSSRQSFNFVISRYYYNKIKYDAQLWLAKTFIESGNFQKAETLLDELSMLFDDELTPFVQKNLDLVYADLFLKSKQTEKAKPYLESALDLPIDRKTIARISYILAQIYQSEDQPGTATTYYQKVIKLNTNYRMAFNAKINLAFLYTKNSDDGLNLRKNLIKMLKDSKNKNYLDQIYYALADIDLKDNDSLGAISNLRAAVKSSTENQTQKAIASLKAADLLFDIKRFTLANNYYDTALQQLPYNYENYNQISKETAIYKDLSRHLSIVEQQDSLLILGRLPEHKLNALADSLIAIVREAEIQIRDDEFAKQQSIAMGNQMRNSPGGMGMATGGGQWYFYNPQARSMGYTEFIAKWGNRALADNWRLSNKQAASTNNFSFDEDDQQIENTNDSLRSSLTTDPLSRNYYLKDIPRTNEQIANAIEQIADALYQAGFIYKEDLKLNERAKLVFEDFAQRTENHSKQLQVYFQLYQLYDENTQSEQKNKYKNLIINNYPDTDYAKLVQDPNYYREMEKKKNYFIDQYKRTYQAFEKEQYLISLHHANQALDNTDNHPLKANFLYIKALSMAQTSIIDSMYVNLENLVLLYPDAEITPQAKNILENRGKTLETFEIADNESNKMLDEMLNEALALYTTNPSSQHFVITILDAEKINVSAIQVRMQDFNKKQAPNLNITTYPLMDQKQVISIGEFRTQLDAMNYFNSFISDSYVFPSVLRNDSKTFVISAENYSIFFNDKDIIKYELFFKEKYKH
jgi:tetratricopeptide (TPR) repeat protein